MPAMLLPFAISWTTTVPGLLSLATGVWNVYAKGGVVDATDGGLISTGIGLIFAKSVGK